jgi:hypothetical protein
MGGSVRILLARVGDADHAGTTLVLPTAAAV